MISWECRIGVLIDCFPLSHSLTRTCSHLIFQLISHSWALNCSRRKWDEERPKIKTSHFLQIHSFQDGTTRNCGGNGNQLYVLLFQQMFFSFSFTAPDLAECKNKRIFFSYRPFPLEELHAYPIPTVHIEDHSIKHQVNIVHCIHLSCLLVAYLSHYRFAWCISPINTEHWTYSDPCIETLYTVHINWFRCKAKLFIHFYFLPQ